MNLPQQYGWATVLVVVLSSIASMVTYFYGRKRGRQSEYEDALKEYDRIVADPSSSRTDVGMAARRVRIAKERLGKS